MKIIRLLCLYSLTLLVACGSLLSSTAHASAGTLFFTPGSGRFDPGSTFTISVKTNVAPATSFAGGATVIVQFPKGVLQAASTSTSGSAFGGYTTVDNNAGTVRYTAFLFVPPSGSNLHLFNITFRAVGTGNAGLSFGSDSNVHDGPTALQNSTYQIAVPTCPAGQVGTPPNCSTPPPATCPAGQVGTPPNCSTPKPTTPTTPVVPAPTPTPTTPTAPLNPLVIPDPLESAPIVTATGSLAISSVKSVPAWESGSVTWATNQPDVTTVVQFGTSKDKLTTTINAQTQEDGTFRATQTKLTPGTRYYYLINAISASSGGQATYSGSFTTRGYPAKITVKNGDAVAPGAVVKLENNTYTTKQDGSIQTLELATGNYKTTITDQNGITKDASFTIKKVDVPTNGKSPALQAITLDIATPGQGGGFQASIIPLILSILGGLLLIGLILGFLLWRRKRAEAEAGLPVATIDDYSWTPEASMTVQSVEQQFVPEAEQPYAEFGTQNVADLATMAPNEAAPIETYPAADTTQAFTDTSYQPYDPALAPLPDQTVLQPLPDQAAAFTDQPTEPASFIDQPLPLQEASSLDDTQLTDTIPSYPDPDATLPAPSHDITIEEVQPDEPSALYDESTGELSIIHHNAHPQGGVS